MPHVCSRCNARQSIASGICGTARIPSKIHRRRWASRTEWRYINHPHIIKYQNVIRKDSHLYIVYEYIESGSLKDVIHKFGNFPEPLAVSFFFLSLFILLMIIFFIGCLCTTNIKRINVFTFK